MSFTEEVCGELVQLPTGKNCCRKALLCGLFLNRSRGEEGILSADFRCEGVATLAGELLRVRFGAEAEIVRFVRAGRTFWRVRCACPGLLRALERMEREIEVPIWEALDFRCGNCRPEFLRGVFLSTATVNDPHKGYHLEFVLSDPAGAERLKAFLTPVFGAPGQSNRGGRCGLYYKSNGTISDLLYFIGAVKSSFDFANICIERDIRNQENRATNCVARNISRSVGASQRQIAAVEALMRAGKLDLLPEELRETARLRLENDSASLSELAALHNPPITKSGLNQRLSRILRAAEEAEG